MEAKTNNEYPCDTCVWLVDLVSHHSGKKMRKNMCGIQIDAIQIGLPPTENGVCSFYEKYEK